VLRQTNRLVAVLLSGYAIALLLLYIFASMWLLESPPPEYFRNKFKERKAAAEKANRVPDQFAFSGGDSRKDK
jgi:hypothetical protein